jgi:DegV family protein with EDD domain
MNKIAVVTDTDSSLPPAIAALHAIQQVPITIHFGEESYTCGLDIDDMQVFQKVDQLHRLPTTAAPSPAAFKNAFERAFAEGASSVVCICVSSKISATYNAAVSAREMLPERNITVIDSLNLSMGQGLLVLAAAEAARDGASHEQVVALVEDTCQRVSVFAVLATLKYLALSGRVGKLAAGLADTLNVKPLLTVRDGKLDLLEKVRTRRKAIDRMIALTALELNGKGFERLAIIHVNNPAGARELQDLLCAHFPCKGEVITAEFTPGLSVHAGSGVVGLAAIAYR